LNIHRSSRPDWKFSSFLLQFRALRACHRLAGGIWRTRIQRTPRAPVSLREEPPGSGGLNAHPASDHSETVRVADYLSSSNDGSSPRLHTGHTFTGLARSKNAPAINKRSRGRALRAHGSRKPRRTRLCSPRSAARFAVER